MRNRALTKERSDSTIPLSGAGHEQNPPGLTPRELDKRNSILKRLDPKGFGLLNPATYEGDDIYLLLAVPDGGKGGVSPVSARLSIEVKRAMDYLLMTRTTPFQSASEFIQSAVVHLLRTIADMDSKKGDRIWRDSVRIINIGIARARTVRRQADAALYLNETVETLKKLVELGEREEAVALWGLVREEIESMDDSAWKARGLKWLDENDYITDPPKAGGA